MSGITPNFDDWRKLTAIAIKDIAMLMQGFDPRAAALGEVVVQDANDPTNRYGVPPDISWDEKVLIAAAQTGALVTAPPNIAEPNRDTHVAKKSLIPWMRKLGGYDLLVNGLSDATSMFVPAVTGTETVWTQERKDSARAMLEREKSKGVRAYARITADEFGVSTARLRYVLKDKTPKKSTTKPASHWNLLPQ